MESYHGKPIDPRQFKQRDLSNFEDRVTEAERHAREFRARATIDVDACYVCGSAEREIVREMYGYEYAQCAKCSHIYLTVRLPQEAASDFFETSSEFVSIYTDEQQIEYRLENITKPKLDFVLDRIDATEGRWLDVGCGIGDSLHYLESEEWDAVGLELNADCIEVGTERFGVEMYQGPIGEYSRTNPEPFDVVTFFGVLELLPDPMADLCTARALLDSDGAIAVGDGHGDSVSTLVHRAMPDKAIRHSIPPILTQQFTAESITTAFERAEFVPDAAWYFGLDFYELLGHLRLSADGFADSELYEYLIDNLDRFQAVIDEDEMSDYILAVGRCA